MRTTVDIPDAIYFQLKSRAAVEGGTVKQLLVRGAENILREPSKKKLPRLSEPPLNKGIAGSLHLTNDMIYELLNDLP